MKKVIVIGCPGSGKSTFGRKLKSIIGLPLYHLDMLFWNEDKTTVSREVFIKRLQEVMSTSKWIIDGNYGSTMEMRIKDCDTVFFLDYSTEVCIEGIELRKGQARSDMPWVENDNRYVGVDVSTDTKAKNIQSFEEYRERFLKNNFSFGE